MQVRGLRQGWVAMMEHQKGHGLCFVEDRRGGFWGVVRAKTKTKTPWDGSRSLEQVKSGVTAGISCATQLPR